MRIATIASALCLPILAASAAASLGCGASFPPPNDEWAAAQTDVGRAEAGGAPNVPNAKLQLQLAQEHLAKSKALIDHDNKRAADLIAVAKAEAQLALSLAKEQIAEDAAKKAQDDLAKAKGGSQ
jgi:hypothetical protein